MCVKALNRVMSSEVSCWESPSFTLLFIYLRPPNVGFFGDPHNAQIKVRMLSESKTLFKL